MKHVALVFVAALAVAATTRVAPASITGYASDDFEIITADQDPNLRLWYPYGVEGEWQAAMREKSDAVAHGGSYSGHLMVPEYDAWHYGEFGNWRRPAMQAHAVQGNPDRDNLPLPPWWDSAVYDFMDYCKFTRVSIWVYDPYDPAGNPSDYAEGFRLTFADMYAPGWPTFEIAIDPDTSLTHYTFNYDQLTSLERQSGWVQFTCVARRGWLSFYINDELAYHDPTFQNEGSLGGLKAFQVQVLPPGTTASVNGLYVDDFSATTEILPEPGTALVLSAGVLALVRRRRTSQPRSDRRDHWRDCLRVNRS